MTCLLLCLGVVVKGVCGFVLGDFSVSELI